MGIQVIDPKEVALREKKRTVVMNTRKLHAWVHYYPNPGDHDELHCHNEDQVFTCFEGECTMRFPDGSSSVLKPGMAALITGGSFYQLENTGQGHMILMGHRSGNQDNVMIIDYVTRQDIRKTTGPCKPDSIIGLSLATPASSNVISFGWQIPQFAMFTPLYKYG